MSIKGEEPNLNRVMEEGKLPPPAANYTLEAIRVISNGRSAWPPSATQRSKSVLAVEQVPSGPDSGTIIAFAQYCWGGGDSGTRGQVSL
ncbi:MAG: hypothetical protein ACPG06_10605 [Alphaproteobacteria bacterium]